MMLDHFREILDLFQADQPRQHVHVGTKGGLIPHPIDLDGFRFKISGYKTLGEVKL